MAGAAERQRILLDDNGSVSSRFLCLIVKKNRESAVAADWANARGIANQVGCDSSAHAQPPQLRRPEQVSFAAADMAEHGDWLFNHPSRTIRVAFVVLCCHGAPNTLIDDAGRTHSESAALEALLGRRGDNNVPVIIILTRCDADDGEQPNNNNAASEATRSTPDRWINVIVARAAHRGVSHRATNGGSLWLECVLSAFLQRHHEPFRPLMAAYDADAIQTCVDAIELLKVGAAPQVCEALRRVCARAVPDPHHRDALEARTGVISINDAFSIADRILAAAAGKCQVSKREVYSQTVDIGLRTVRPNFASRLSDECHGEVDGNIVHHADRWDKKKLKVALVTAAGSAPWTLGYKALVQHYAGAWESSCGVMFEWVDPSDKDADITVARKAGNSYSGWSYVGAASKLQRPSMQLTIASEERNALARGVVLHEFGHALGLLHEHSHLDRTFKFVSKELAIKVFRATHDVADWSDEKISANVFATTGTRVKTFDPDSIMMYDLPGALFESGVPTKQNTELSDGDKKAAVFLFGPRPQSQGFYTIRHYQTHRTPPWPVDGDAHLAGMLTFSYTNAPQGWYAAILGSPYRGQPTAAMKEANAGWFNDREVYGEFFHPRVNGIDDPDDPCLLGRRACELLLCKYWRHKYWFITRVDGKRFDSQSPDAQTVFLQANECNTSIVATAGNIATARYNQNQQTQRGPTWLGQLTCTDKKTVDGAGRYTQVVSRHGFFSSEVDAASQDDYTWVVMPDRISPDGRVETHTIRHVKTGLYLAQSTAEVWSSGFYTIIGPTADEWRLDATEGIQTCREPVGTEHPWGEVVQSIEFLSWWLHKKSADGWTDDEINDFVMSGRFQRAEPGLGEARIVGLLS